MICSKAKRSDLPVAIYIQNATMGSEIQAALTSEEKQLFQSHSEISSRYQQERNEYAQKAAGTGQSASYHSDNRRLEAELQDLQDEITRLRRVAATYYLIYLRRREEVPCEVQCKNLCQRPSGYLVPQGRR